MTPAAGDGPEFENVIDVLTIDPATAVGGAETVVVTSARGETAVAALAVSGSVFGPWLVAVPIVPVTVTDPALGAVNVTPMPSDAPAPRLVDIALNVTSPLAGS